MPCSRWCRHPTSRARLLLPRRPATLSKGYPFLATPIDLAARGYVEEEFFVSGNACRYTGVGVGNATPGPCAPYTTRIIVRRPSSPELFNGTVLAEWQNVTAQYEVDHYWHESSEHLLRSGYAWVGISAQRAGVQPLPNNPAAGINTLKAWNPTRYAPLDVTNGGLILDDALRFDIYSQAIQALREPAGIDPLGPLDPDVVIAIGTSQSGTNLAAYHNSIYPLTEPVVDGFFIGEARGAIRTDQAVPVFRFLSEVDVRSNFTPPDAANYRHWEVAGASHAGAGFLDNIVPLLERDQVVTAHRVPQACAERGAEEVCVRRRIRPFRHLDPQRRAAASFAEDRIHRHGRRPRPVRQCARRDSTIGARHCHGQNSAVNVPDPTVPNNTGGLFCSLFGRRTSRSLTRSSPTCTGTMGATSRKSPR